MKKTAAFAAVTLAALLLPGAGRAQEAVPFTPGMVVTSSVRIAPGVYDLPGRAAEPEALAADPARYALLVIRGDGVEVDLTGVTLRGIPLEADPDQAAGIAVFVDGGRGVTLRGGAIRGYRFGILARGTRHLRIRDMELSYAWKPWWTGSRTTRTRIGSGCASAPPSTWRT